MTLGESSYSGNWHGSGQIPARAGGFKASDHALRIDRSDGRWRHGAPSDLRRVQAATLRESSEIQALAYAGTYRFDLFSNFTLYLDDPENGDEIQQIDRRTFYGGKVSYRTAHDLAGLRFDTTLGADVRSDDIHEELWHAADRVELNQSSPRRRRARVAHRRVRQRRDHALRNALPRRPRRAAPTHLLAFAVDNRLDTTDTTDPTNPRSGVGDAHQFSPKASVVLTPLDRRGAQLDLYANWGNGFHSNDVRGAFTSPSVALAHARDRRGGRRADAVVLERWDVAASGWLLNLDNETTWDGDDGTTAVSPATRRYGVELETRFEITPWLAADGDVTFTHSQFSTDRENGGGLALAPKQTWAGGLSARHELGPGVARGGLRFYGIGDRPASDDGTIVAPGFTQVDLHLGYRTRRFDVAFDVGNLLDGNFRSAQFDTVSRLRTDPAVGTVVPQGFTCGSNGRLAAPSNGQPATNKLGQSLFYGCEGVDFTPAYPLTAHLMATIFLD